MAEGLARVTAFPGVCLVTSGAGATNLLTAMAAAYVAHSPVVVLVGGVSREHSQKDAFQAELLQALWERLDHLEAKLPLVKVVVFGSHARGTYTVGSDVDLLVVYRDEPKRGAYALTKQALKIQRLEPHLYTEAD